MHVCAVYSVRTQDSLVMGIQNTLLPVYAVYYEFEWFVSISQFDWVVFPQTVFKGVVASTAGTKDPLSSDEQFKWEIQALSPALSE